MFRKLAALLLIVVLALLTFPCVGHAADTAETADEMIEELKKDKEKTKAGITGVEIAARIIKECKPYCQGVHIMALGWESKVPDLLKLAEI